MHGRGFPVLCLLLAGVILLGGCSAKGIGCTSVVTHQVYRQSAWPAQMTVVDEVAAGYIQPLCVGVHFHCNAYVATDLGRRVFAAQRAMLPQMYAAASSVRASSAGAVSKSCLIPLPQGQGQPPLNNPVPGAPVPVGSGPLPNISANPQLPQPPQQPPNQQPPPVQQTAPPVPAPSQAPPAPGQPATQQTVCVPSNAPNLAPTCTLQSVTPCPPPEPATASANVPIQGYGPADLQQAYNVTCAATTAGQGALVAVLTFGDGPGDEKDLATYRQTFGLPPCTSASGCFKKVNFDGSANLPPFEGPDETLETLLDIEMVSAICPNCHILLVETPIGTGTQSSTANLLGIMAQAAQTAAQFHPVALSVSLGWDEDAAHAAQWNAPGMAITVATGDFGYFPQVIPGSIGNSSPGDYNSVIAVGGTTLFRDTSVARGWREIAWKLAGSGCSSVISKASYQTPDLCNGGRLQADVSADADIKTGVDVYGGSLGNQVPGGTGGWHLIGGTSAAAPMIAGIYALGGHATGGAQSIYAAAGSPALNDITTGANGTGCNPAALCSGATGLDGPTGLGTPNGIAAFH